MSSKIIPVLLIVLLSLASYINIFSNEFVWDDQVYILDNSDIRSFDLKLFFSSDVDGLYRPLRTVHYAFVYSLAGKEEFFYHVNSLLLHTLISVLVYIIIFNIFNKKNISLVSALIFTVHPIHTGRVTNITAGFDLLGIFFMLLAFYLYIKFSKLNSKKYFLLSLFVLLLAVFSSEEAIVLPILIILYEFSFNREKFNNKNTIIKNIINNFIPFFAIALSYVLIRLFILGIGSRAEEYLAGNFFLTILTMIKVYAYYIYLLIFPSNLSLYHDIEAVSSIFDFKVLASLLILASIIFLALRSKNKIVFFSVFWFFIALIPFSNVIPIQNFIAERYLYVPSIGFSLLTAYFFISMINYNFKNNDARTEFGTNSIGYKKIKRNGIVIFIAALLIFYVFSTVNRNNDWKDNFSLWSKTVITSPGNSRAHDNLGFTYDRLGEKEKALDEFKIAVKLDPGNYKALANLGVAYAKVGRYNESISALKKSVEIKNYYKTHDKLGLVYSEVKEDDKAILQFKEAIKLNQRYAKAHNDLGTAYARVGEFELALSEFNEAIKIDKDYADAHYNLGVLLEFLGEKEKALKEFEFALRLEPENELYGKKIGE
jgi:protein O-mannosyl-transferase